MALPLWGLLLIGWVVEVSQDFYVVEGEKLPSGLLVLPRSRDFVRLIENGVSPYVTLVECAQAANGKEAVIIDVRATIPQEPAAEISPVERLAVEFQPADDWYPDVHALRKDFPRRCVLHLNLVPADKPASLCLFAVPWTDIKLRLTANELLFLIQTWLNDTAAGTLHREDQPLEPLFLFGSPPPSVILSPRLADRLIHQAAPLHLTVVQDGSSITFIEARPGRQPTGRVVPSLVIPVISSPHEHCILYNQPWSFEQLHEQLVPIGIDLLEIVQVALVKQEQQNKLEAFGSLLLLLVLQRKRHADAEVEPEIVAFLCVGQHAQQMGLIGLARSLGLRPDNSDTTRRGGDVTLQLLSVHYELTPNSAAIYSGNAELDIPLVAIGAGALGSQVVLQAVRGGITRWTVIDFDILLPHNLVRHALSADWLGHPKAKALASVANNLLDEPALTPIVADVQKPGDQEDAVNNALKSAGAIIDLSASVSVARDLAFDCTFDAKRCSLFVSPSGRDLVLLGEDIQRRFTLDFIEAQYYRAVASDERLQTHLVGGSTVGSCRNVTSRISQDLMGLQAAQAVRLLRKWIVEEPPKARVICSEEDSAACQEVFVVLGSPVEVGTLGEWRVVTDTLFLGQVREQRTALLPNETGGALLAHVDVQRRIVYVVHQIPAPPDSERQPTMYIRGAEGLSEAYEEIQKRTLGNLVYIGEWHSHPDTYACSPSADDLAAGVWLADKMRDGCLPGVMLIVGDRGQTRWMLCSQSTSDAPAHLLLTEGDLHE